MSTRDAVRYARTETLRAASDEVGRHVRARVLDTLAATVAGYRFPGGDVARAHASAHLPGDDATLLDGSGRRLSCAGATLANATSANVLDVDDGHRLVKGHPAATVVPAALAAAEAADATVGTFLDAVLVGYELGVRAGLAIHATDGVYSGSGSWGAVGASAAVARIRDLNPDAFTDAIGTAEYHAPRTPIMRGVERPGMTKDGIGWGAYTGTTAVELVEEGFTASGSVFDETDAGLESLGEAYHVTRGYLKPYPCCRWAQPGVDAVLELLADHEIPPAAIDRVVVETFEEATHLRTRHPDSVEAAEYSYPYTLAATLVRGQFTPNELRPGVREDATINNLADRIELAVEPEIDARFPDECLARVAIHAEGDVYRSGTTRARGATNRPLSETTRREKARELFEPTLDADAVDDVRSALLDDSSSIRDLVEPLRSG